MSILKRNLRTSALIIALFIPLLIACCATVVQGAEPSDGPYKDKKLSPEELQKVIRQHAEWFNIYKGRWYENEAQSDKRRANLRGANLREANLSGAGLYEANLSGADLRGADLRGAKLSLANLVGANLVWAKLVGANLNVADLSDADLAWADLSGADLSGANLSEADLIRANFSWAHLNWLDLSKVADYISAFLGVKGLSSIRIENGDVTTIVELRKRFKEAGFKNEEKSLTSALRKYELGQGHPIYSIIERYLIGGMLTDFGAYPAGALLTLLVLIFVFVWFYLVAIRRSKENAGIWRVRPENRLIKEAGESDRELVTGATWWRSLVTAFYFSIMSAFYFGWKEFNVDNWIARIQKKEYTLQATGWVKMVSGIQSLTSLYLVVLFLATYFENLFE